MPRRPSDPSAAPPELLAARVTGPTGVTPATSAVSVAAPVVFLHGFAQNGACGGPLVDALAADRPVLLPDLPGHGDPPRHPTADLPRAAALVDDTALDAFGPRPVDVVGYSMGGRVALVWATSRPGRVRRMVLVGATAGLATGAERTERRAADEQLARRLEEEGVAAFLDHWLALPLFAGLPDGARFEVERRRNTAAGLAASLRHCGTGTMDPLWEHLGGLCPTLFLAGADDTRFAHLARRMADAVGPGAAAATVPGAGHAAHLERPDEVAALVRAHLTA